MTPVIYDIMVDSDAERFGLSTLPPGSSPVSGRSVGGSRWDRSKSERNYLLSRCFFSRPGQPRYIVLHIQEGTTRGSLDHWVNGADWQGEPIQASSTACIQKDGSILRVIPEQYAPWTNGDVRSPTAQSAGLRSLGGNPNSWCLTIELEGYPNQPLTDAQLAATVWLLRDWSSRYGIPLDRSHILPHSSLNTETRAHCPSALIYDQVFAALEASTGPAPAPVTYPRYMDKGLATRCFGTHKTPEGAVYRYTEGQPISTYWLERYGAHGFPAIKEVWTYENGERRYIRFESGPMLVIGKDGVIREVE